ncbi:hypothetical protein KC19_5G098000 [Ceratodon purpureus]|uniref:Uncharacterized protein n=1 Tax=Ceratodon purpureus TaxID=3225 RepID=A0A8T0I258_CERPU|nr:hypothetical protein KC19_5G098000 [Ceratodon purpureus]
MAFEVARVHQLICSRVGDGGDFGAFKNQSASVEADQAFSRSCSPQEGQLHRHFPVDLSHSYRGFDHGCDTSGVPLEVSSCSTETESDEDDDLLQSLAQQIAHSTLDEETSTDMGVGVRKGHGSSETRNLSHVEVNEQGRLSPTSWSSGSWSSGSLLSGSRSSSKGSSRVSSQVSSPSSAPSSGYQDAWDTLYAAAGEVVRLKMNDEKKASVFPTERPSPTKVLSPGARAHYSQQTRPSGQLAGRSTPHSTRRKEENMMSMNQAQQNWASKCAAMNAMASPGQPHAQYQQYQQGYSLDSQQGVNTFYHPGKFADSKTLQRNRQSVLNGPGSGVRVVFLGAASGRESGTGVFLPRSFEPKKKNDLSSSNAPAHGCGTGAARHGRNAREGVWPTLQQSMNRSALHQPVHEPCLPTEWTY